MCLGLRGELVHWGPDVKGASLVVDGEIRPRTPEVWWWREVPLDVTRTTPDDRKLKYNGGLIFARPGVLQALNRVTGTSWTG